MPPGMTPARPPTHRPFGVADRRVEASVGGLDADVVQSRPGAVEELGVDALAA